MLSRREFLHQSAAAVASAALTALPALAHAKANIKTVGVQLWSIATFLEKDFAGSMKLLSSIGYRELELFGPYPFSSEQDKNAWTSVAKSVGFSQSGYFNHSAKEFKTILDGEGLTTPAMHVGLDTLRNNMGPLAEAAHLLGQKYAGIAAIPASERRTLDDYKRVADDFNAIGEKAKSAGLQFYYHNHGYGLTEMEGKIPFDLILGRTDPATVFFEMDTFWTVAGGADPIKYLDAYPGRFKLMHVKDMSKPVRFSGDGGDPQQWIELFPYIKDAGSGVMNLKDILAHAKKNGLEHFIVENDVIVQPKESLESAYRFVSSVRV
jgi:sugar phosphate isomerase/epimerase